MRIFSCISSDLLFSNNIEMCLKKPNKQEKDFQIIDNGSDHATDHLLQLHLIWSLTWLLARYQVKFSDFATSLWTKKALTPLLLLTRGQLLHGPQGAVTQSLGHARKQTWALGGISSWSHKLASVVLTSPSVPFLTHLGGAKHEIE